jgi:hypothetical protein
MPNEDDELHQLLDALGPDAFDDNTKRRVDGILADGQAIEPETRRKLVTAAQRGLRVRHLLYGPFEVLAFELRRSNELDIDQLAADAGVSPEQMRSVERGAVALVDQEPEVVARWIRALGVEVADGLAAVEQSVRAPRALPAYARNAGEAELDEKAQRFVEAVRIELERLDSA